MHNRNGLTNIENKWLPKVRGKGRRANYSCGIQRHKLLHIKQISYKYGASLVSQW